MTSDNDKNVQYKVSLEPLNTPPIFTISLEGKIIFGEAVKNYPHDEQAREFIKCVEQITVNQPQSGAYQLGYDTARAEVIEEAKLELLKLVKGLSDPEPYVEFNDVINILTKLERGAE